MLRGDGIPAELDGTWYDLEGMTEAPQQDELLVTTHGASVVHHEYKPPWHGGHRRRAIMHWLMFWKWGDRLTCHYSRLCCQYVDRANCNNVSAPKGLHHRDGTYSIISGRRFGKAERQRRLLEDVRRHQKSGVYYRNDEPITKDEYDAARAEIRRIGMKLKLGPKQ